MDPANHMTRRQGAELRGNLTPPPYTRQPIRGERGPRQLHVLPHCRQCTNGKGQNQNITINDKSYFKINQQKLFLFFFFFLRCLCPPKWYIVYIILNHR